MSDLVEEFLVREKDGLAGLEGEIPSAFDGKATATFYLRYRCFDQFSFVQFLTQNFQLQPAILLGQTAISKMHTIQSAEVSLMMILSDETTARIYHRITNKDDLKDDVIVFLCLPFFRNFSS